MRWPVVSETWTAQAADPSLDLLDHVDGRPFALLHGEGRFAVLGQGPLAVLEGLDLAGLVFERSGPVPAIQPDLLGFTTYEAGYDLEPLAGTPLPDPSRLPRHHWAVYESVEVLDRATGMLHRARRRMGDRTCTARHGLLPGPFSARFVAGTDTASGYRDKVQAIREEIARGNVYQVNLTRQETWAVEGSLEVFARRLRAANPAPRSAFVAGPDWAVISSSPETFLTVTEGRLVTRPIKGTAPRGLDPVSDRALAEQLMACPKNRAELAMIVDLLRNDAARACVWPSVAVEAFPELETYANVHHLVATVSGRLREGISLEDLFRALFPGGSITGCPKLASMRLIRSLEAVPRSLYTGALGWIRADGEGQVHGGTIRTAWVSEGLLRFGVGGGITWDSDPGDEYDETVHKGRSLVQCLS